MGYDNTAAELIGTNKSPGSAAKPRASTDANQGQTHARTGGSVSALNANVQQSRSQVKKLAKDGQVIFALGLIVMFAVIYMLGRVYWDERYYTPEEGVGYYLGMVGGILMLVAVCYSMAKRVRWLRATKFMRHWLRLHIVLGIVGPYMVLFHSTFHIGSLNGGIALVSMTMVFLSGVIGRYLYSKIYLGLDGTRMQAQEVRDLMRFFGRRIHSKRIESFQESVLDEPRDLLHAFYKLVAYKVRSWIVWNGVLRDAKKFIYAVSYRKGLSKKEAHKKYLQFRKDFREYMNALRKAALMGVYEKIFSFWRHAHVPLLYLLLISGIVHVIAVHMY
ncbi:MAG: hypothetical protein OEY67_10500 [Gammaproteobacteria bacterium]|nr:hypothetical protein [Gammaproteobacteria bacterium]